MTLKQPENDPTFDVLAYMRSLSPIPDGKELLCQSKIQKLSATKRFMICTL